MPYAFDLEMSEIRNQSAFFLYCFSICERSHWKEALTLRIMNFSNLAIIISNDIRISLTLQFADITSNYNLFVFFFDVTPFQNFNDSYFCFLEKHLPVAPIIQQILNDGCNSVFLFQKLNVSGGLTPHLLNGQKFFLMNHSHHNDQPSFP